MGPGSDSLPVSVSLMGQQTYLADSMQFTLEYFLRMENGLPGVYYSGTSFRREDPDAMHLNQFYHVECELVGGFAEGISVTEGYVINVVRSIIQQHLGKILESPGSLAHLESLLGLYYSNGSLTKLLLMKRLPSLG